MAIPRPPLRFGDFVLERERRRLTRAGEEVSLSPHLVEILEYLASQPGELVTKDQLLDRFWPDVHVTENTLTRAIADIRKALGDSSAKPRFIQTAARRGYRFVAAIDATVSTDVGDPFRHVVSGRQALERLTVTSLIDAVKAFEDAVSAMPQYAPAHVGLASALFLVFERTRITLTPDQQTLARAVAHARRACELDEQLGDAWATLGYVLAASGRGDEARAVARRATALEPTSWRHHFRLSVATWGEERLRAGDRTLALLPDFAPAVFTQAMVFVARQAFDQAARLAQRGADVQSRQLVHDGSPFPAVGHHWLRGLLLLHAGDMPAASASFVQELNELNDDAIYATEFRANAWTGLGFTRLAAGSLDGAESAFRDALAVLPAHGRALVGLGTTLSRFERPAEAGETLSAARQTALALAAGGRWNEAAMVSAAVHCATAEVPAAADTLERLLVAAPPGPAGWLIPIDPALAPLRGCPGFAELTTRLAARAA